MTFQEYKFFDGGVVHMMDIPGSVNRCKKEGFAEEDIVLDVLMIYSNNSLTDWGSAPNKKTLEMNQRLKDL